MARDSRQLTGKKINDLDDLKDFLSFLMYHSLNLSVSNSYTKEEKIERRQCITIAQKIAGTLKDILLSQKRENDELDDLREQLAEIKESLGFRKISNE